MDTKPDTWINALTGYACAAAAALLCTLIGFAMEPRFDIVNIAMVYLLAVVIMALTFSRGAAIASSVLCVAAFDFVFVPPRGTFTVDEYTKVCIGEDSSVCGDEITQQIIDSWVEIASLRSTNDKLVATLKQLLTLILQQQALTV